MNNELATLQKLRAIAQQYVSDFEKEVRAPSSASLSADREKSVRSLRNLLKIIEEIAELEERFKRTGSDGDKKEIDDKQRCELARRIEALRSPD